MVVVRPGDWVWLSADARASFQVPIGCQVKSVSKSNEVSVSDDEGRSYTFNLVKAASRVRPMHPSSITGVDDMIMLGDLNHAGILRNVHIRYRNSEIYTYTGSILVAVNPYKIIPGLYEQATIEKYSNKRIGEEKPHIFAISDNAYTGMMATKKDQCVVVSGESGSGKTESTKLMLQFLAAASGQHSSIEQQILESNPILEAFGNAKTLRNDNSSRFGKYIDIIFNKSGQIECARIEEYLLEKSRLIWQQNGERNFHIFYMLFYMSQEEKKQYMLKGSPADYPILKTGHGQTLQSWDDREEFGKVTAAMKVLNFKPAESRETFKLLVALLHYSKIEIKATVISNLDAVTVMPNKELEYAARILGVDSDLVVDQLIQRNIQMRGETVTSPLNYSNACDVKDAFIKGVYGRLFSWIVDKINSTISRGKDGQKKRKGDPALGNAIGLLDIFGFECFETNSFEQLCINYTNESLQQFFVQHIFKLEQEEYEREGIKWSAIDFTDNQSILDMIAQKPMNIFALIDEESVLGSGSDASLLNKLKSIHGKNENYRVNRHADEKFYITHFAGEVGYSINGFLEKNRDTFHSDSTNVVKSSSNKFLLYLFSKDIKAAATQQNKPSKKKTLANQFKKSLDELMSSLYRCHPFFVRCVKPNEQKKALVYDRELVCRQLTYSGMMETITIRKAGYPIRYEFDYFAQRYDVCVPGLKLKDSMPSRAKCELILSHVLKGKDWKIGFTKVFMKDGQEVRMEDAREAALLKYVIRIQRAVRGWYQRRTFLRLKTSILMIQTRFRGINSRVAFNDKRLGFARLQALWRSRKLQFRYNFGRERIIGLQAACRGYLVRKHGSRKFESIVVIQAYIRGMIARRNHKRRCWNKDLEKLSPSDRKRKLADYEKKEKVALASAIQQSKRQKKEEAENQDVTDAIISALDEVTGSEDDFGADNNYVTEDDMANGDQEDLSDYKFSKFAATYFTASVMHSYLRRQIKEPLLHHDDEADRSAALAVWITILRFMGDMSDPKSAPLDSLERNEPVMSQIHKTLGRAARQKQKLINQTIKKKSKLIDDRFKSFTDRPTTSLEKIHFIIGTGILRGELRDEIYCQICKQLTQNPSRVSAARGWVLLSLCFGCFGPSEQLEKYLRCFMRDSNPSRFHYYEEKLKRTIQNGSRQQPPSWLELQNAKHKKQIPLTIHLMDGAKHIVKCDSATNSEEICQFVAEKANLTDNFGFSLFVSLFDKVSSLGSGKEHVMDAISQCEQYAKEQGVRESNSPYRVIYRKEVFTPWYNPSQDRLATQLIHAQLRLGIHHGEYQADKSTLVKVIAQHSYYNYGAKCTKVDCSNMAREIVPEEQFKAENWGDLGHKELLEIEKGCDQLKQIENMIKMARQTWTLQFSRFYQMIAVSRDSQYLIKNNSNVVIMAVNWAGIFIVSNESEQILQALRFMEIKSVELVQTMRGYPIGITIDTVLNKQLQFNCTNAPDVHELVSSFMEGLKARSRYAVAVRDVTEPSFLKVEKGDLVRLDRVAGDGLLTNAWDSATCLRNKALGSVQSQDVWVLATLTEPDEDMVKMFKMNKMELENLNKKMLASIDDRRPDKQYFTLEEYASEFFNVPGETKTKSGVIANMNKKKLIPLWAKENEPIQQALLERTPANLNNEAVLMHLAILKHSGDYVSRKPDFATEITDQIFMAPLKRVELRDELYCQLMKQLTRNMNRMSEQRTWHLMWLACGIFAPSPQLMPQLNKFLSSRGEQPIPLESAARLYKTNRQGARHFPPHAAEVEAIEHNTTEIMHKVFLGPDQIEEIVDVESSSKARDICVKIGKKLEMKSIEGFSLFVRILDKVISIKDNQFFFDYIRQLSDLLKRNQSGHVDYQVYFMRKLWVNYLPGRDPVADMYFNFPQEVPKYLRGYYNIPSSMVGKMGALIFIANYGHNKELIKRIDKDNLEKLVPQGHKLKPDTAKKEILKHLHELSGIAPEDAKLKFLTDIHKMDTFGSAFFEVRQTTDPNLPQRILVAIMKRGIVIIDLVTKKPLIEYGYAKISNWSCGETYFTLQVGSLIRASKLICETTLGYKMENLVSSYIDHIHQNIQKSNMKGNF